MAAEQQGVAQDSEGSAGRGRSATIPFNRLLLAVGLVLVNVADVAITRAIISYGGAEANPLMAPIIHHPALPLLVKTLVALLVGVLLIVAPRESKVADRGVLAVLVLYVVILGWNTGVLIQAVEASRF